MPSITPPRIADRVSPKETHSGCGRETAATERGHYSAGVLSLQRTAGNRAVSGILSGGVSQAIVRRTCAGCEAEEEDRHVVRRVARASSEGASSDPPATAGGTVASPDFNAYVSHSIAAGHPLEEPVRRSFESTFGRDLSGVRVHTGPAAARAAASIDAHAFTLGSAIWFGRGQYRPETPTGRFLLAHELAHTIQQHGRTPSVQPHLVIGGVRDAAEVEADRAARAAALDQPVPLLGQSPSVVRCARVRTVESVGGNREQRLVTMDDGTRYRVTRHTTLQPVTRSRGTPTRVIPGANADRIFIRIEFCQGRTEGRIELGADVPAQAQDLVRRIVRVVQSGGNGADVLRELQDTEVTPSLSVALAQSRRWRITGGIQITVGREGVTAGGGTVGVQTPAGTFGGSLESGPSGTTGRVTYTVPLPGEPRAVTCHTQHTELEAQRTFTCEVERTTPPGRQPVTRLVPRWDERRRYVYFHYAVPRIEEGRTARELAALRADVEAGYRVSRIEGFTSPEGPMARGARFRGNTQLAQDRADVALERVRTTCSGAADGGCFVGGDPSATGRGELYTRVRPLTGSEVEGGELAAHAVGQFETSEAEARHREDPATAAALRTRTTPDAQAEIVYPLLRRAVVTLTKIVMTPEEDFLPIPARTAFEGTTCPEEVEEAARASFRLQDAISSGSKP